MDRMSLKDWRRVVINLFFAFDVYWYAVQKSAAIIKLLVQIVASSHRQQ
jgi:hypothetical protein